MISVLAYNIHFGNKLDLIKNWLLKNPTNFDVICFQEFPFDEDSSFLEAFVKNGYDFKFAPSSYLTKIFAGGTKLYGELTLYKKSELELLDFQIIKLGANFLEKRFRVSGQKTSLMTIFKHKNNKVVIANSHLVCYAPNSRRINQITKIIKRVKTLGDDSAFSTVILGDFNYTSRIRQKKLIEFMAKNDLANAYKAYTHKYFFIPQQLDYVFFNNCAIKNVKVGKTIKFSDHSPVTFDIEFAK
jgi:endonuclease/exonuclease/phosphatase family metal-dependent hydrolase